jgi:hypothetical protein
VPVLLDVGSGYDGHYVFKKGFAGLYGDNSKDGIDDDWRNGESQMKRFYDNNQTIKGIVYDAWNGFAEGFAATPTLWHSLQAIPNYNAGVDNTALDWLRHQFAIDPRACDHLHYRYGRPSAHVYGDICKLWQARGAAPGFGAPLTDQQATPSGRGQKNEFENGGTIYWYCTPNGCVTYEVPGAIKRSYHALGEDSSPLGLPTASDAVTLFCDPAACASRAISRP